MTLSASWRCLSLVHKKYITNVDVAYWMSPGTRRYLEEDSSTSFIGFRCAMTRTGGPEGNDDSGGNKFKVKRKKVKRKYK